MLTILALRPLIVKLNYCSIFYTLWQADLGNAVLLKILLRPIPCRIRIIFRRDNNDRACGSNAYDIRAVRAYDDPQGLVQDACR